MRIINLFLCVLLFCVSCTSTQDDTCEMVEYDHTDIKESFPLSSFVDKVETVRLELPEPYFFGGVGNILFDESGIYINDSKQEVIYRFDANGIFLNTIGKRGEGPGEYVELSSHFLGEKSIYVSDRNSRKIHEYTFNGEYIGTISYPFELLCNYIMALPNGNFLCHTVDGFLNGHGVWILNRQGEMEKTVLSIPEKYPFRRCGWNTMALQADGRIQIYDAPVGVFYLFDPKDESIKKVLRHKSNFKMTGDFVGQELNSIINESYADGGWVLNGDRYLFSVWSLPETDHLYYTLYDKKTKKSETCNFPELDVPGVFSFHFWKSSNLPNTWVSYVGDEYMEMCFPEKRDELHMSERTLFVYKLIFKR